MRQGQQVFPHAALLASCDGVEKRHFLQRWENFIDALGVQNSDKLLQYPRQFWQQFVKVWLASDFVSDFCIRQPQAFLILIEQGFEKSLDKKRCQNLWSVTRRHFSSKDQLMAQLRYFRNAEQVRIIWRMLTALATFEQTTLELSLLAEWIIQTSVDYLYALLEKRFGTPKDAQGCPQELVVIAMGKLGARELNVSSDVDLIFSYPKAGHTQGGGGVC